MDFSGLVQGYKIDRTLLDEGCVDIATLTDQVLSGEKLGTFTGSNIFIGAITYFFRSSHLIVDPMSIYKIC